jgi:hypothetical protein
MALAAGAAEHDVVPCHLVAQIPGDPLERLLERGVGERVDTTAVVADEMMMMVCAGLGGLEASNAVADVDALYEAKIGELLEDAVHARDPDSATFGTDAVEDLLRGQAAALLAEVLDDRLSRAALA